MREEGATEFSLFLDKLAQSIIGRDPAFRMTFQSWLRDMALQPSLRAYVFAIAQGATASCQDRVMLTANDMAKARLLFHVERGGYDAKLPAVKELENREFRDFLLAWQPWQKAQKGGHGLSEETAMTRQFALWDMEYEQPLAVLEKAIAVIDRQLDNGSASTTSGTGETDRLQLERQALAAQRNALVSGAKA